MTTSELQKLIEFHPGKLVQFLDHQKEPVPSSYHVSEIKSAVYETVDCGAMAHQWRETILQLWLSPEAGEAPMRASKISGIFKKASDQIDLHPDAEIKIEYGNENFPPVLFHVESAQAEEAIIVSLRAPVTVCKLEERGGSCARPLPEAKSSSCCQGSSC